MFDELTQKPDFRSLRQQLERAIDEMEADKIPIEALAPEIVRLGVLISLALSGPRQTIGGLSELVLQFPKSPLKVFDGQTTHPRVG